MSTSVNFDTNFGYYKNTDIQNKNTGTNTFQSEQTGFFYQFFEGVKDKLNNIKNEIISNSGPSIVQLYDYDDTNWDGCIYLDSSYNEQKPLFIPPDKSDTERRISYGKDGKTFTVSTYNLKGDDNFETPDKIATYKVVRNIPDFIKEMSLIELAKYREENPEEFDEYFKQADIEVLDVEYNTNGEDFKDYLKTIFKPDFENIIPGILPESDETKEVELSYHADGKTISAVTYYRDEDGTDSVPDKFTIYELECGLSEEELNMTPVEFEEFKINSDIEYSFDTKYPKLKTIDQEDVIDSKIEYFEQGQIGDCGLLASIYSIAQSENGKKVLDEAISANDDGSYNVYFKGINETYTVTQDELTNAENYSSGDNTVLLLELAIEKALDEILLSEPKDYHIYDNEYKTNYDSRIKENKYEIYYNLTNRKDVNTDADKSIVDCRLTNISRLFDICDTNCYWTNLWIPKDSSDEYINNMLDRVDLDNAFGFIGTGDLENTDTLVSDSGNDFEICGHHAYAIKSYDSKNHTVTIVNPHNSCDSLTINVSDLKEYNAKIYYQHWDDK